MMSISEASLHVPSSAAPQCSYSGVYLNTSHSKVPIKNYLKCRKKRYSGYMGPTTSSSGPPNHMRIYSTSSSGPPNHMRIYGTTLRSCFQGNISINQPRFQRLQCHIANGINGISSDDINGKLLKESINNTSHVLDELNGSKLLCFEESKDLKLEKDLKLVDDTSPIIGAVKLAPNTKKKNSIEDEAWRLLQESMVHYCGSPIGTIAAMDPSDSNVVNYDQVFIRDFIPSGVAFLLKGEYDIVRNFILHTLQLQSWERTMDCYSPGQGLMPASFKVRTVPLDGDDSATEEVLDPDFGEAAIGRVAPVDSGLWWIILLRAYGKCSGDFSVQERIDVQTGIKMILKLCLADGFDMFPTLLVTDGSCMIDRRMGIHGHPLEIQALFYSALLCAREILAPEDGSADLIRALKNRLIALSFHIREYYWIDMKKLNEVYRYKTEEYSFDAVNKFNIYPDQIPPWLVEWMPDKGGYFIGNLQPAHMDFRFFSLGNLWSIVSSLATTEQSHAILDLVESKWSDLVADMPFKICYPALEGLEWQIITGSDPKNTPWSYHNGGSWPTLLWQLTVACIKMKRPEIAERAVEGAERRIAVEKWPEYYDTKRARFIGKQAHLNQTWSIAGYLVAKLLLDNPAAVTMLTEDEDVELINALNCMVDSNSNHKRKRGQKGMKNNCIV